MGDCFVAADHALLPSMKQWLLAACLGFPFVAQGQSIWLESGYKQSLAKRTDLSVDLAWRGSPSQAGRAFADVQLDHQWGKHLFGFYECRVNLWGTQARNTYGLGVDENLKWRDTKLLAVKYSWRYHDDDREFRQSLSVDRKMGRWKPKAELETWYRPWDSGSVLRKWRATAVLQYYAKGPIKWELGMLSQSNFSKKGNVQSSEWALCAGFQWRLPGS